MYVQVKSIATGNCITIPTYRSVSVKEFKKLVERTMNVKPENQRLFFAGRQLENQYRLFDYGININNVILLMVKYPYEKKTHPNSVPNVKNFVKKSYTPSCSSTIISTSDKSNIDDLLVESKYFKIGDYVDVNHYKYGSWFLSRLVKIKKDVFSDISNHSNSHVENDGLLYVVAIEGFSKESLIEVKLPEIRPYMSEIWPLDQLKPGDQVIMNYNFKYPNERGFWYDVEIQKIKYVKGSLCVIGNISVGMFNTVIDNCTLIFLDDIYKIKPYELISERTHYHDKIMQEKPSVIRAGPLYCATCRDDVFKFCYDCGCYICGSKEDNDKQVMCDECDHPYHLACLLPPLKNIPEDNWYCSSCRNDKNEIVIKVGDKLKSSKKKIPGFMTASKRNWGKGMACVARTNKCNIVPLNHFGPIPGVEVGTTWLYRIQVSEAGIHRPIIAGIHGRGNQGAFSIILSGSYKDDIDYGNEFLYTGSGGRDWSKEKRTAQQSSNQELTRCNRALALNCNAQINDKKGATAVNWKKGKPIRVIRNYKLYSKYAPELGNRYEGIYKVVKYYPEVGKSGFIIWRFLLKRDDPNPAPWTTKGKQQRAQLGLNLIYPENYLSAVETETKFLCSKRKRTLVQVPTSEESQHCESNSSSTDKKKRCPQKKVNIQCNLDEKAEQLIEADALNTKYWDDCKKFLEEGKNAFLVKVEETFSCICCKDILYEPVTTKCSHNICRKCLRRSFSANIFQCPFCRANLGKRFAMNINKSLAEILSYLFPGYYVNRYY